jgi:hypothetical protein
VEQVEALANMEIERTSHLGRLTWEDFLPPFMTGEFLRECEKLTKNLTRDDRRRLLIVAEEAWVAEPPPFPVQRVLRHWHDMESSESQTVTQGMRKGWADGGHDVRRVWALTTDRLSNGAGLTATAKAFLFRAQRLAEPNGDAEAVRKAGEELLGTLKVAEREAVLTRAVELEAQGTADAVDSERDRASLYWRIAIGRRYLGLNDKQR